MRWLKWHDKAGVCFFDGMSPNCVEEKHLWSDTVRMYPLLTKGCNKEVCDTHIYITSQFKKLLIVIL